MIYSEINTSLEDILSSMGIRPTALTDNVHFMRDLGLDSLDVTDLIMQVETRFGIRIPDEDGAKLQTFGQLKNYLASEMVLES
ncbi:phosphopantetheine-binding protein [Spirosoma daeguense]